jgi:hypothetical protein
MSAEAGARVERLLEELRGSAGPQVWPRVEELVRSLVDLYGSALARTVAAVEEGRRAALADDELVGSLMALHGLHPLPIEARVRRALDAVAAQLGRVELVALDRGRARLRAVDAPPVDGAEELLRRSVEEAAPELDAIEIDGLRAAPRGSLVQIDLQRSRTAR